MNYDLARLSLLLFVHKVLGYTKRIKSEECTALWSVCRTRRPHWSLNRSEIETLTNIGYYYGLLVTNLNLTLNNFPATISNWSLFAPNPVV